MPNAPYSPADDAHTVEKAREAAVSLTHRVRSLREALRRWILLVEITHERLPSDLRAEFVLECEASREVLGG